MANTNPIVCIFFLRDGYCAKGSYCTFSHDKNNQRLCKNFPAGKCKHGNACSFVHSKTGLKAGISGGSGVTAATSPPPAAQSAQSQPKPAATAAAPAPPDVVPHTATATSTATIDSLWGFDDADDPDGVYFYGAPGTTKFQSEQRTQLPSGSYSKVLTSQLADDEKDDGGEKKNAAAWLPTAPQVAIKPKQMICQFYASGNCKFGSTCRYEHMDDEFDARHEEEDAEQMGDCGICLAPPDAGGLYGLMSHCNCVFCLKCIRNWRNEGLTVTHKSEQVRMCPLCRTDSHFVVPSIRVVVGEKKDQIVTSYKQSLAAKPCMYYQQDGACPFGSSCFYKHVNRDGSIEEPTGPRIIIKEDSTTEICPTTKLSDFLRTAKSKRR
jgi:hypothetical protein